MQMTVAAPPSTQIRDDRFRLTGRVLARLHDNARYGVLTSEQHARLDGGSKQKVVRLLQRCVERNLLKRLGLPRDTLLSGFFDARPSCFAVTPRGLRVLSAAGMPIEATPKRSTAILAHDIEVAETCFLFNAAVAAHGGVRLIDQPELFASMPPATRGLPKPLRLHVKPHARDFPHLRALLKQPTSIGVEPDRLLALALPNNTGWVLSLELDRATEDINARRIKGKATYLRKVLGYYTAWRDGVHIAQWGEMCKAFRVLVVTTTDTRIRNMIAMQEHVGAPAGLFLYATPDRLKTIGVLGPAWVSAKREGISLIDRE
jgi:hypothetical protein